MTVIVAVKCTDGAIVGADSVATSASGPYPVMQIPSHDKVSLIGDRILVAGTGEVGLGQRFKGHVSTAWKAKVFNKSCIDCAVQIATAACQDFSKSGTPRTPHAGFGYGAILAAPFNDVAEVVEFSITTLQPELKIFPIHFVSMGSGQTLADPFLAFVNRVLWKNKSPSIRDGLLGVFWTLFHTITVAPGGVGAPIQIGVLKRENGMWHASVSNQTDLEQISQHIAALENGIHDTRLFENVESVPPPPPPTIS